MFPRLTSDSRIDLSRNELSHPCLESILAHAFSQLKSGDFRRYPNVSYAVAPIAERLSLNPEEMLLTPGSDSALRLICQYYLHSYLRSFDCGGILLLQHPNYFAWEQSAELLGIKIQRIRWSDMCAPGREMIQAAESHRAALIGISIPNGPVGICISSAELDELIETVRRRGHLLIIDSCYQAFNGLWTTHFTRAKEQVVVVQSLSKSHGLAGARLSVLAGNANLVRQLANSHLEDAVSCAALSMGCAVLERSEGFEAIWNDIKCSRKFAAETLDRAGLRVLPSGGNFLTFCLDSQEQATGVEQRMSAYGYRIKHLTNDIAFSNCLRITIQDEPTTTTVIDRLLSMILASRHGDLK